MLVKALESTVFDGDIGYIKLTHGKIAIIDREDYGKINKYFWHAKKSYSRWYACRKEVRDGKERWIRMHRVVARTPGGYVTHHRNCQTLDNRKSNLQNLTPQDHHCLHMNNMPRLQKKD